MPRIIVASQDDLRPGDVTEGKVSIGPFGRQYRFKSQRFLVVRECNFQEFVHNLAPILRPDAKQYLDDGTPQRFFELTMD